MSSAVQELSEARLRGLYWGNPPISARQIAREFGTSHGVVTYRLHKFGIPVRPAHSGQCAPKITDIEGIKQMYGEGMVLKEIAAKIGASWEVVRKHLRRAGVEMKPRHARVRTICKERGCNEPVYKKWHNVLKGYYGTRCYAHHKQHYAILNRHRVRRLHNVTPDKRKPWELKYPEMQPVAAQQPKAVVVNERCVKRACPFPSVKNGLCRQHYLDSIAEVSILQASSSQLSQAAELYAL